MRNPNANIRRQYCYACARNFAPFRMSIITHALSSRQHFKQAPFCLPFPFDDCLFNGNPYANILLANYKSGQGKILGHKYTHPQNLLFYLSFFSRLENYGPLYKSSFSYFCHYFARFFSPLLFILFLFICFFVYFNLLVLLSASLLKSRHHLIRLLVL